jgi:hypothetical protein
VKIESTDHEILSLSCRRRIGADFTHVESDGRISLGTDSEDIGKTTKNSTIQSETELR